MALLDHEIPTVYINKDAQDTQKDVPTSVVYETVVSGSESIEVEYFTKVVESTFDDISNTVEFDDVDQSIDDSPVDFFSLDVSTYENDTKSDFYINTANINSFDLETDLFFYSSPLDHSIDLLTHYRINFGNIYNDRDVPVDLTLAEAHYFNFMTDVLCATDGSLYHYDCDVRQRKGRIGKIYDDIFSADEKQQGFICDLINSTGSTSVDFQVDIRKALGSCVAYEDDIYNSTLSTTNFGVDIKTRSLFTAGFFLDVDEFTAASGIGYVDILDFIYDVDESTIKITKDGTTVSGIDIHTIPNGRRVYFDPVDDFFSHGEVVLNVYAESTTGEVLNDNFYLLYGYDVHLNENEIRWDPNEKVPIRAEASNLAVCSNTDSINYYFITKDLPSFDLGAMINSISVESKDLNASIYPQSKTFFYGKTYKVTVSGVRDFHNNIMEPFVYSFTIEDKPS